MRIPALAAALVLAGCLGASGVTNGSTVTILFTALDDGQVIADPLLTGPQGPGLIQDRVATFQVGTGSSGMGFAFESRFLGLDVNESAEFTVHVPGGFVEERRIDAVFPPSPVSATVPRNEFVRFVGREPVVGDSFDLTFFPARVDAVNETAVTYSVQPEEGQRDHVPFVGAYLVTEIQGNQLIQHLEPDVGATFAIQPSQGGTTLNLQPGSYRVLGVEDDQLVYEFNPMTTMHVLLDREVTFQVTILQLQGGAQQATPVDGNYGVRTSPQIGVGSSNIMPSEGADEPRPDDHHGDDGHGDHTH